MQLSLDLAFFIFFGIITFGAVWIRWASSMHNVCGKGDVGAGYWGTYGSPEAKPASAAGHTSGLSADGYKFRLPKPSEQMTSSMVGSAVPGAK